MLRLVIAFLSLLPNHAASQIQNPDYETTSKEYEARKAGCRIAIQTAAKRAKKNDVDLLITTAGGARDPLHRVVSGYALYRLDPNKHSEKFLSTFVESKNFPLRLPLLDAFNEESKAPIFPGDEGAFSYWSVMNALIGLSKQGNAKALKIWLIKTGGDGEYGEGKSEEISDFLFTSPQMVIDNWKLVRKYSHIFFAWGGKPDRFIQMRKNYLALLSKEHPFRTEILKMIDRLKAEAFNEWAESNPDSKVITP